jgi:sirohydrochlorin cobaltochelatase
MADPVEKILETVCSDSRKFFVGEILVRKTNPGGFALCHRDDEAADQLKIFESAEDAIDIAKHDDAGEYRALKTAPNLRHGWRLDLEALKDLRRALDYFYPARLAIFAAWKSDRLQTTPLRETLDRQSGMYRAAAKISDSQINDLVADFCRSDGGCVRTILWTRDRDGAIASTELPKKKFDPTVDQARGCSGRAVDDARAWHSDTATVPLLCQEACNLLIAECRKAVKGE